MKDRCPSSKFLKRAFIIRYKFVYDGYSQSRKGTVANIIDSENDIVWGGLFEINDDNLAALNCYEGYPKSYNRKEFQVKDDEKNIHIAIAYYRKNKKTGEPSSEYRQIVIQGAQDFNLPEDYIKNNL
jgi:gamma-glutamylcyclotransferase (GGCT)/AIG2-like uncharacterized protein YtfP